MGALRKSSRSLSHLLMSSCNKWSNKAKCVKTRCLQEWVRHLEPKFQGEGDVVPGEYFFGFYKTRHILLSDSPNCTVLRAVVLTQYRRVTYGQTDRRTDRQTDRQTDGIAVATKALAMRALRRAVKTETDNNDNY